MSGRITLSFTLLLLAILWWGAWILYPGDDSPAETSVSPLLSDGNDGGPAALVSTSMAADLAGEYESMPYPSWAGEYASPETESRLAMIEAADWETIRIGRSGSFYEALRQIGVPHETIMQVVSVCSPHANLKRVKRGDSFMIERDGDSLRALRFDIDRERYVMLRAEEGAMEARLLRYPIEETLRATRGVIRTSLYDALRDQGADPVMADQIAEILGWEIDFFRDLRRGDEFALIYREFLRDGRRVRDPHILAVHFLNQNKNHRAYRFNNDLGLPAYYRPSGESLERQFLRAPLKFTRISSRYGLRRRHPVLGDYRPHYGVDYAAPAGTPVMATADGVVSRRASDRASGRTVALRHGNGYESYYLHLSRYQPGLRVGDRVKRGDVIGYVGQTGWATGPHLDYRIKKNDRWVDPNRLSLPPAEPVAEEDLPEFKRVVAYYDRMIEGLPEDAKNIALEEEVDSLSPPISLLSSPPAAP